MHNRLIQFLAITAQFAILVLVIRAFELVSPNFGNLMVLALGGFVVNHFLPERLRLPWFVLISLVGLKLVAQNKVGLSVTCCGLTLIGICHLPIPFAARIAALLAAAAVVSLLRVGQIDAPVNTAAWIVLGSMFMFRTMSYLYELRHQTAPFSLTRAMAYFFMLPNVCFVLFPLVDYRTFSSSHFNDQPERLYTRGLHWMLRGVVHLLLYRLVYQLMTISPLEATDLLSVVRFMLGAYLLYLRVSGWFHLIVGLLLMYGFNLPETHHFYLLASSFTDFWRRINIYWKDFLLKVFFYPAYFRLKRLGPAWAMALATLYAFFVTWLLHSYQFFWIRGEWLITWQDSLFWGLLALLVLGNALWELRTGRNRSLATPQRTWKSSLGIACKTIGTFVVICSLWTLWSCKSWEELSWLATAAGNAPWEQIAVVTAGLAAIGLLGAWLGPSVAEPANTSRGEMSFWRSAALVTVTASLLLAVGWLPESSLSQVPALRAPLLAMSSDGLNYLDLAQKRRGYYEELDVTRIDRNARFLASRGSPDRWRALVDRFRRETGDFMIREHLPSTNVAYAGGTITINRWGMRDRDYELEKPVGVVRLALLGSSHEFGRGLSDGLAFETLVEKRLNADAQSSEPGRYEILNFAVDGYGAFQHLCLLERNAVRFQPDIVLYVVNAKDEHFTLENTARALESGCDCPYGIIDDIARDAQITPGMSSELIEAHLRPFAPQLYKWAIGAIVAKCRANACSPYLVFRPSPAARVGLERDREEESFRHVREITKDLFIPVLDLTSAFRNARSDESLVIGHWDDHTNELGHRLLADEMCRLIVLPNGGTIWNRRASK